MHRTRDLRRTKGRSDGRAVQQSRTPKRIIYSIAKASIFFFKKSFKQKVTKKIICRKHTQNKMVTNYEIKAQKFE